MSTLPDNSRLMRLKLDGFTFGTVLHVCPRCDHQQRYVCTRSTTCPLCDAAMGVMMVTPELVRIAA